MYAAIHTVARDDDDDESMKLLFAHSYSIKTVTSVVLGADSKLGLTTIKVGLQWALELPDAPEPAS